MNTITVGMVMLVDESKNTFACRTSKIACVYSSANAVFIQTDSDHEGETYEHEAESDYEAQRIVAQIANAMEKAWEIEMGRR